MRECVGGDAGEEGSVPVNNLASPFPPPAPGKNACTPPTMFSSVSHSANSVHFHVHSLLEQSERDITCPCRYHKGMEGCNICPGRCSRGWRVQYLASSFTTGSQTLSWERGRGW